MMILIKYHPKNGKRFSKNKIKRDESSFWNAQNAHRSKRRFIFLKRPTIYGREIFCVVMIITCHPSGYTEKISAGDGDLHVGVGLVSVFFFFFLILIFFFLKK
jgi:hypothetical protein